jgi:hypothetical protein
MGAGQAMSGLQQGERSTWLTSMGMHLDDEETSGTQEVK